MNLAAVPPELQARDQWVAWRNECAGCGRDAGADYDKYEDGEECPACDDRITKVPRNAENGRYAKASVSDGPMSAARQTWTDFDTAAEFHNSDSLRTDGVGFVFDEDGPVVGIDLDDCRDAETDELEQWAIDIVTTLNSFVEISTSGTGLHVYVFGELPEDGNRRDDVEMYDEGRYFAVTGEETTQSTGSITHRQDELEAVHSGYVESTGSSEQADLEDTDVDLKPHDELPESHENDLGMSLEEVREQEPKVDAALSELEPDYDINDDSPSGYDFSLVSELWFWRFDHQQITDIVRKYRSDGRTEKTNRPSTYLGAAAGEQYDPRATPSADVQILENREAYESIDELEWGDGHRVLDKPPRAGGSHDSMDELSEKPLVVLASRHAICEHHMDILADVMPKGKTAIHYEGTSRTCNHGGGTDCPEFVVPGESEQYLTVVKQVHEIIEHKRVIRQTDCPEHICRDQFLSIAAEYAYAVVTVPDLFEPIAETWEDGLPDANLLIDEEQALDYFRPPSVDLAEITTVFDPDGSKTIQTESSNITGQLDTLDEIRERIYEEQEQRAGEGKTEQYIETDVESDVLAAIEYLETLADEMAVSEIAGGIDGATAGDVVKETIERLNGIEVPKPSLSTDSFRAKVSEYADRYYYDDAVDPGSMIECVLFGYDERKFDFKNTGESFRIRMIGGRDVFHSGDLRGFNRIAVIAGPEGELFFEDLGLDATVLEITEFRYSDDFVIVPLGKERDERMEPVNKQRDRAARVSAVLNKRSHPHLAVAGTKGRAKAHHARLDKGPADIIASPENPMVDLDDIWSSGGSAIIYENSAVSRGIDAPFIDISTVVSSGFATPYWEARKKHYRGEDNDEYQRARGIERQIKSHELTNAVLRPSPTRHIDDITGTKFIVCADWDAPRIRYIDQETPVFASAESASSFVQQLTAEGAMRRSRERRYDELDGNDREYIKKTMAEEFAEVLQERPGYDISELETWAEGRYLTKKDTVADIEKAVPPNGKVETGYVTNLFPEWNGSRVTTALHILEKKGIVESWTESDGSSGDDPRYWSKEIL